MNERKRRVLWHGEYSGLSTGFGVYGNEVLKRLYATGKYELCEFASFAQYGDARLEATPWPVVSAMYNPHIPGEYEAYHSHPAHKFGTWKFDRVLLDFRPDHILAVRDTWMDEHILHSPFRSFYDFVWMPTVDAVPQQPEWVDLYLKANALFSYSDWGADVLRDYTKGMTKVLGAAPPGADLDVFRPTRDKRAHRERMGLEPDVFVVGTTMRCQRRKLFPDLVKVFTDFIQRTPKELADKSYLYLHTGWPDLGWDIPNLIHEAGLSKRCLLTYHCQQCGLVAPRFFQDSRSPCRGCGQYTSRLTNSDNGVSRQDLANIYNLWDVHVQLASLEGFGMPQVEAAACGLPVLSTDYSAMSDVVRKLRGFPIKVQKLVKEAETGRDLAIPDNEDLLDKLLHLSSLPTAVRAKLGWEARHAVERHYNWDVTAQAWMDHIDSVPLKENEHSWGSPARFMCPDETSPPNLDNEQYIRWGFNRVAGRPDLVHSREAALMLRHLNWGFMKVNDIENPGKSCCEPFYREHAYRLWRGMADHRNFWENERLRSAN